jgi:predicted nucleic acid-binding protein
MALTEIQSGSVVFVDANIFIYHLTGRSDDCSAFLMRIESGDVRGFTGQVGVLEVAHRLMMLEAAERGSPVTRNPAARLAKQPKFVQGLSKYYFAVLTIPRLGVEVLPLPRDFLTASQEFRQGYGLLVNDSLVPMHMRQAGLSILASADAAFDRIPEITRFTPVVGS